MALWEQLEIQTPERFESYFCEEVFKKCFDLRLRGKNGGGRDRMTPEAFMSKNRTRLSAIANQCLEGSYKFAKYNERLSLKGRNKFPRVISIPTVKDRLVLSVLNAYLQYALIDLVNKKPANQYIRQIQNFIVKNQGKEIVFFKTDFSAFYDNVNKHKLMALLKAKNLNPLALQLVWDAINTPTVGIGELAPQSESDSLPGIPQGLAISNILSAVYLEEFDNYFKDSADLYLRYVDDILMLNPHKGRDEILESIESFALTSDLTIKINRQKTVSGVLGKDDLNFLGYRIYNSKTSLRKDNLTTFINRLARECVSIRNQFNNKSLRPEFLQNDDTFLRVKIEQINLSVTGIIVNSRLYGWIHHYQQIDDIGMLHHLDRVLRSKLLSFVPHEYLKNLASFAKCYFLIRDNKARDVAFNLDVDQDINKVKAYMIRKGWLSPDANYSDEDVMNRYNTIKRRIRKMMEIHIGRIS